MGWSVKKIINVGGWGVAAVGLLGGGILARCVEGVGFYPGLGGCHMESYGAAHGSDYCGQGICFPKKIVD